MIDTVLFDFDQTLVDSGALSALRELGLWTDVSKGLPSLKLYPGIPEALAHLRANKIRFGIVSQSPRDAYLVPACSHLKLKPDVIVGYHEVTRRKPSPEPYLSAIAQLHGKTYADPAKQTAAMKAAGSGYKFLRSLGTRPDRVLVVGDASNDITAAKQIYVTSVGALWGAHDRDELILAEPTYLCDVAAELIPLVDDLKYRSFGVDRGDVWRIKAATEYQTRTKGWTKLDTSAAGRPFLREGEEVYHLRRRHKGTWSVCHTNGLVSAFKSQETSPVAQSFKKQSAEKFADELAKFLAQGARYMFVPTSKMRGDAAFDARNDLVRARLAAIRPDLHYVEPISLITSVPKASTSDDVELRNPAEIVKNYAWNAADWVDGGVLYVIDDVLTKGGHMKAAKTFVLEKGGPKTKLIGLAWALHCS
jgi:phosphoglycolate phosphatase-like HAD superfamily hydrolase